MGKLFEVDKISYGYKNSLPIIKDISFSIGKGELFTILGPNGAGKSTLLNCVAGLFQPTSGEILFNGEAIAKGQEPKRWLMYRKIVLMFMDML